MSAPATPLSRGRQLLLMATISLGTTTLALTQTVVVPALGRIAEQLDVSATAAGWVLTANLLTAAVSTPVLGRLGDLRGERTVLLAATTATVLGTLLAAVAASLPLLIVARVLQGLSFCLFPLSISVLRRELPPDRLGVGMAMASSTMGVGGVLGMVAAGVLIGQDGDYRTPFWVCLAVLLAYLAATTWLLPHRPPTGQGRVDWWGALVLGAGLAQLLLAISQGNAWGWSSPVTIGCVAGAAVTLAGWWVLQHRVAEPLVRPAMLADRRMVLPNVAGLITGTGMFASFLVVLQYVQTPPEVAGYGFGASLLEAVLVYMVPPGIAGVLLAPIAGRVVTRVGALPTLLASAVFGSGGFLLLALARGEPWVVLTGNMLTNVWITVAFAALPALVVAAVPPDETGVANAVNSITRSGGSAIGSAVAVVLLAGGDSATGFPPASAITTACLLGLGAAAAIVVVAAVGMLTGLGTARPTDPELAEVEEATAGAGGWAPVSGLR